jgi:hypothetical protein
MSDSFRQIVKDGKCTENPKKNDLFNTQKKDMKDQ